MNTDPTKHCMSANKTLGSIADVTAYFLKQEFFHLEKKENYVAVTFIESKWET